jgi:hypothetical protein
MILKRIIVHSVRKNKRIPTTIVLNRLIFATEVLIKIMSVTDLKPMAIYSLFPKASEMVLDINLDKGITVGGGER